MKRRRFVKTSAAAACGVAAASIWGGRAPGLAKTYTLKFGTSAPEGTPWADLLKSIKKEVEASSEGAIKMELYLGTLGSETELVESLQLGTIEAAGVTIGAISAAVPEVNVLELPFLFDNHAEVDHVLQKVVRGEFDAMMNKRGFELAGWSENGFRSFGSKSKVIRKPEDLKGLKMRSQPSEIHLAFWKALGVKAQPINNAEALGALQTGIVDGFDNSPIYALVGQWWTAIKHWSTSQHIYQPALVLYSKKWMSKLPDPELRALLKNSVAGDVEKQGLAAVRKFNADVVVGFKAHGIEVAELTAAERKVFADQTKSVHDVYTKKYGTDLYNKITKALETYRAKMAKGG